MRKFLFVIMTLFVSFVSFSQEVDDIDTDRPDQSTSPLTVPKGFLQVEVGASRQLTSSINFQGINGNITLKKYSTVYSDVLLRYGLTKNVELRVEMSYLGQEDVIKSVEDNSNYLTNGISPLNIGTKVNLLKENGCIPSAGLVLTLTIPIGKGNFQPSYTAPSFLLAFQNTLSRRLSLSYGAGGQWNGEDANPTGYYTASLGINIAKKLSAFIENYSFFTKGNNPDFRADGGLTYLIKKNIQLDISGGFGITEISPDYFIGAGVSFRIPK